MSYLVEYLSEACSIKHPLIITGDQLPFHITSGTITRPEELRSAHEEADLIIAKHTIHLSKAGVSPISVLCEDTDVLVLLMHYYHFENLSADLRIKNILVISVQMSVEKNFNIINNILPVHCSNVRCRSGRKP